MKVLIQFTSNYFIFIVSRINIIIKYFLKGRIIIKRNSLLLQKVLIVHIHNAHQHIHQNDIIDHQK
jgi:hypothetical protein